MNNVKQLSESELKASQLRTLQMVHDYCSAAGLKYYMVYGTLLGAVRHHGYIPWDDDIDIAMPRKDYETFIHYFNHNSKNNAIRCIHIDLNPDYYLDFAKVYDTQTLLIERVYHPVTIGAYIDVFPIDAMPDDQYEASVLLLKIQEKELELKKHNSIGEGNGKRIKTFIHNIERLTLRDRRENTIKEIDKLGKSFSGCLSEHAAIAVGGFPMLKEYVPKEWYGEPQLMEFEKCFLYAPAKPHELLTQWYGDYMTPPPIEKQHSHHNFDAYWNK
jgi:lipopolysaccharide cholinephosphotransferase